MSKLSGLVLFLAYFIIGVTLLQAHEKITLSGKLEDEQGKALAFANVTLEGTRFGTTSDSEGNFYIRNVPFGEYTLRVSSIGYMTSKQAIVVDDNNPNVLVSVKEDLYQLPQLTVISQKDRLFTKTPGAVGYIDQKEISRLQPLSGNEVFRRVSGVHVVDEEGLGLRTNIGIRGLSPDRSRNVLILEDGVPVALNPYGEPEMYYTPAMDRMVGVEVLKGSGQILYGPQTIGGVINYITADPPEEETFGLKLQGGQGGYFSGMASYGNTIGNAGYTINFLRKQADAVGPTAFELNDLTGKVKILASERSQLGIKFGVYQEQSNSTYVGITQSMFDQGGDDFAVLVPDDELNVSRYSLSLNHTYEINSRLNLQSSLYGFNTVRNWRRQDYAYSNAEGTVPADWSGTVWGDPSVAGGAIYLRERNGNRNREFNVGGLEQRLTYQSPVGSMENELMVGYRLLYEQAFEQRINGSASDVRSGALINDEIRTGRAASFFVNDRLKLSDKFDVTAGLRGELYNYHRDILREGGVNVNEEASNTIFEIIPGAGLTYRLSGNVTLFSGIHRGYAPPRIKDALDFSLENPVIDLRAEQSWNYELGARSMPFKGIYVEMTYFYMDFENQIIPTSESIGGFGFGLTNAGETIHTGLEFAINANSKEIANTHWNIALDLNTTYAQAYFNSDRVLGETNINGFQTPYAPNWLVSAAFTIEAPFGTGLRLTNTYVGKQFTDELNTIEPSANGRIGLMEAFNVIDATLYHTVPKWNTNFNLSVKNLTDERYIATRRPQGIRVGLPRFITAGVEIKF